MLALIPETSRSFNKALEIIDSNKYSNLTLLGGDSLYSRTIEKKGEKARNLVFAVPWFSDGKQSNQSEFEIAAQELWNGQINWRTAMAYDSTVAIVEGLQRMGDNPTRQGLQQILSAPNFSTTGAAAKVEFNQNGDRKITPENDDELDVLVRVKCDTKIPKGCGFTKVSQK